MAGYDPEKYLRIYEGAEGETPREKINAMRRENYAEHKEEINAQKRAAYAERKKTEKAAKEIVIDLKEYIAPDGTAYHVNGSAVVLDYKPHEKEIAELLGRKFGEEVSMVPRVNFPKGVRTPDFLISGKPYDLKTIGEGAGNNTIFNRIKKSSGQSDHLVIDISKSGLEDDTIKEQLEKVFWSKNTQFVKEVIIVKDGKIHSIRRREK